MMRISIMNSEGFLHKMCLSVTFFFQLICVVLSVVAYSKCNLINDYSTMVLNKKKKVVTLINILKILLTKCLPHLQLTSYEAPCYMNNQGHNNFYLHICICKCTFHFKEHKGIKKNKIVKKKQKKQSNAFEQYLYKMYVLLYVVCLIYAEITNYFY